MGGMRALFVGSLALLVTSATVGCGSSGHPVASQPKSSGGSPGGRPYSLESTQRCLNGAGYKTTAVKHGAVLGSHGNLLVTFTYGTQEIYMAFAKDATEARALEDRAVSLAERHEYLTRSTILAGVRLTANVFYFSPAGPVTVVVNRYIAACLRH